MLRVSTLGPSRAICKNNVAPVHIKAYEGGVSGARAYHHGNLRRELLDAAMRLFAERGRFDFTMRELARSAGVTHNAPYRHFADRWALLDAIAGEGFTALRDATVEAAAAHDEPRARIQRLGEAYVRFASEHPDVFRLMFLRPLEDASPELRTAARASYAVLEETIATAHAGGLLTPDATPRETTLAAWSLVHGLASLIVGGQVKATPRGMSKRVAAIAAIFCDGAFRA
jgi:AcrR family transcriptional regulator